MEISSAESSTPSRRELSESEGDRAGYVTDGHQQSDSFEGFILVDDEWKITYLNETAAKRAAVCRDEIVGKKIWESLARLCDAGFREKLHSAKELQRDVRFDHFHPDLERRYRYQISSSPTCLIIGQTEVDGPEAAQQVLRQDHATLTLKNMHLEELFAHAPVGMVLFEAKEPFRVLIHNRSYQKFFPEPFRSEGMVGLSLADFVITAESDGVLEIFREVARTRKAKTISNFLYEGMPHRRTWWNWHLAPIIEDGEIVALVNTAVEVTDEVEARHELKQELVQRKGIENQLRRERELLEKLFDTIPVMITMWDPQVHVFRFNKEFERILGWTEEEAKASDLMEKFYPDPAYRRYVQDYMESLQAGWREFKVTAKNGGVVQSSWANIRLTDDTRVGIGVDLRVLKQAEDDLRRSEAEFRSLFELSAVGSAQTDPTTGRFVRVNRRFCEITGYTEAELLKRTFTDVTHPEDRDQDFALVEPVLKGESDRWESDKRYIRADGQIVWVHVEGRLITDATGRPYRTTANILDITERKRAEAALRESEERFRTALKYSPVLFASVDDRLRYEWILNPHPDLNPSGVIGKRDDELDNNPGIAALIALKQRVLEQGIQERQEITFARSDGNRTYDITVTPVWDEDKQTRRLVTASLDITERKRAEDALAAAHEALEREHRRLKTILEVLPAGVFIADAHGHLVETNTAARRIWGGDTPLVHQSSFDQYRGWFVDSGEHVGPDDWGIVMALHGRDLLDGQEIEIETFDGQRKTILNYALPVRMGDRLEGAVAVSVDVTQLRNVEKELRELNASLERSVARRTAELEKRNEELQQFAYVASHDMQEPLRKIQTFADMIKADFGEQLGEEGHFYLDRIEKAAARMSQLLGDLLTFSRVTTRQLPFTWTSVLDVMQEVLSDLEIAIAEAGVTVDTEGNIPLQADVNQLRQLLNHLVMNAIKYRRDDVPPLVRVSCAVLETDPGLCRIVVEDNGIGFEQKYAERIFQPFERLHGKASYPGTGMGLAICRRIIERHHGTIRAESTPGEGSRFIIELPVHQESHD